MPIEKRPPFNSRRYRKESEKRYLFLVFILLVVVGGGLIALIYGPPALITALPCLLGGSLLVLGPWLILTALEKWRDRMDRNDLS